MKKLILPAIIFYIGITIIALKSTFSQGVSINDSDDPPDNSAMLDVQSTSKGMLTPRMTISERDAIANPANGLIVFCTDDDHIYINRGTPSTPEWSVLTSLWMTSGTDIYYYEGNIGIGETSPLAKVHVSVPGDWAGIVFSGTGLNDLEVDFSGYTGTGATIYAIRIQNAGPNPNMIEISSDGGSSWSSPMPIAPNIDMGFGVYANFANTYGHTYDDTWVWTVNECFPDMFYIAGGNVGVGTVSPHSSAILEVSSDHQGFLPPRLTQAQRSAITSPAAGLLVFQTDSPAGYYYYTGTNWVNVTATGTGSNSPLICTDYDGNAYPTITIGLQTWMVENLRVTHYRNGNAIPNVTDGGSWSTLTTGAYCWYANDQATNGKYGALYNWYAVNDSRSLCPEGWHEPTDAEWTVLTTYLGGESVAGGKMKSITALWNTPNTDATNSSFFSGLPGGYRLITGSFDDVGELDYWWSSSEQSTDFSWGRGIFYNNASVTRGNWWKRFGFSMRCVKDN